MGFFPKYIETPNRVYLDFTKDEMKCYAKDIKFFKFMRHWNILNISRKKLLIHLQYYHILTKCSFMQELSHPNCKFSFNLQQLRVMVWCYHTLIGRISEKCNSCHSCILNLVRFYPISFINSLFALLKKLLWIQWFFSLNISAWALMFFLGFLGAVWYGFYYQKCFPFFLCDS